jgi:hypothetical protein
MDMHEQPSDSQSATMPSGHKLWSLLAYLVVAGIGAWIIAPASQGTFVASADHFVHLTRAYIVGQAFQNGQVRDWSDIWGFGFPVGELYPLLGDAWVNLVHVFGLGQVSWHTSYALAFAAVFVLQGLVAVRLCGQFGLSRLAAACAGLLAGISILADPGFYREGGWSYTVQYGVWPQSFAIALAWWAMAECEASIAWERGAKHIRAGAIASVLAAFALLAHPIALPVMLIGFPLLWLSHLRRVLRRPNGLARLSVTIAGIAAAAFAISAWWYVPMLVHKDYAANYGWLHQSMALMFRWLREGHFTQNYPSILGAVTALGMVTAFLRDRPFTRFCTAFAVALWSLASTDIFWNLRLDLISDSFTHLQYQRFLTCAKPGFYALAGFFVGAALDRCTLKVRELSAKQKAASLCWFLVGAGALSWSLVAVYESAQEAHVGEIRTVRDPDHPDLDEDFLALATWSRDRVDVNGNPMRTIFQSSRNSHWSMDFPVLTDGHPIYKTGFTPGDNFVHKPESDDPELWARAGVDALVVRTGRPKPLPDEHAAFGSLRVLLPVTAENADGLSIWMHGAREATFVPWNEIQRQKKTYRATIPAPQLGEKNYVQLPIAAFPRWQLTLNGQPLHWFETPILRPFAWDSPESAPLVRIGKARGPDGTEPSLITVLVDEGGELEVTYQSATPFETALALAAAALLVLLVGVAVAPSFVDRRLSNAVHRVLQRVSTRSILVSVAAVIAILGLVLGYRLVTGLRAQSNHLFANLEQMRPLTRSFRAGPFKADMVLRPALITRPRQGSESRLTLRDLRVDSTLRGWVAIEDDDAQRDELAGEHRLKILARKRQRANPLPSESWTALVDQSIAHAPNSVELEFDTADFAGEPIDLRIEISTQANRGPRIGLDLVGIEAVESED